MMMPTIRREQDTKHPHVELVELSCTIAGIKTQVDVYLTSTDAARRAMLSQILTELVSADLVAAGNATERAIGPRVTGEAVARDRQRRGPKKAES